MPNRTNAIRLRLEAQGLSIADWSRLHGYNIRTVRAVIRGELKAKRGVSHKIAVELGLKSRPQVQDH